jgi:hypothetical protein
VVDFGLFASWFLDLWEICSDDSNNMDDRQETIDVDDDLIILVCLCDG